MSCKLSVVSQVSYGRGCLETLKRRAEEEASGADHGADTCLCINL